MFMRVCTLLLLMLLPSPVSAASVLVINSYHPEFAWVEEYSRGIASVLGYQYTINHHYLDTKRLPQDQFNAQVDRAWAQYQSLQPDIVVLADDNAVELLSPRFSQLSVPVVVLGVNANPRTYGIHLMKNVTGVLERPLFNRSILLAAILVPHGDSTRFLVLFDNSPTSTAIVTHIKHSLQSHSIRNIHIDFQQTSAFDAWQQIILEADGQGDEPGYEAIMIGLYHNIRDNKNQHIPPETALQWAQAHAPVPHFGFWGFSIGKGRNIGGYVLDGFEHGKLADTQIIQIVNGAEPQSVPFRSDIEGRYIFSKAGMQRWQLTLPEAIARQAEWVD
ncbi:ABC transporter substrate-binding protein [Shewanella sp. YLB-07]|uniref:ABC transporter substrate-binding protein n=1 Tax=Shewanella sp. YLB-07 TaxID=2601268 RepID=UPI00128DBC1D|nr:hypothetical protein [Shewanella sp. YLB-07]MPY24404.1 hypothetical protein [Shewanella sp. YLB-07]